MGSATEWVRRALVELGSEAPDQAVKSYIRERDPNVPEGQVALALRKLRGQVIRTNQSEVRAGKSRVSGAQPPDQFRP